jgi:hypothetical protein
MHPLLWVRSDSFDWMEGGTEMKLATCEMTIPRAAIHKGN